MTVRTAILDNDIHSRTAARAALAAYPDFEIAGMFATSGELLRFLEE